MARGYGEPVGSEYGADEQRERWRDSDRERSNWRSGERDRGDDRGFFERAGEEIRSWFSDDDDDRRPGGDWDRGRSRGWAGSGSSSWDRDNDRGSRSQGGGWSGGGSWDRQREGGMSDRERGFGRSGRGGSDYMSEDRSSFGGMAQGGLGRPGGSSWDRGHDRGFGPSRGEGRWTGGREERSATGFGGRGASRSDRDWEHGGHAQSMGEANRGWSDRGSGGGWSSGWDRGQDRGGSMGYGDLGDTLGGFGNQRFGSSQDDHYRSWRDRQMQQLDRDYEEYCRECEQNFHNDFDSWRRSRKNQGQQQGQPMTGSQGSSDELQLGGSDRSQSGAAPGAGTASGTSGESSAVGGDSLTSSSATMSDTGETPTGGSGSGVSGRSRTRS